MDYAHGTWQGEPQKGQLPVYVPDQEGADTEFRKEFPPDAQVGSEMADSARVWRVYRKEANALDNALLEGWSDTLDVLLIFAGLFSAAATAFVIESYQFLQLDNTAYTAAALYILVSASNHSTGMALPAPPDLNFKSSASRWINGLWFTSILLSLAVAFLTILLKQWITEYRARNRASAKSPRIWAHRRELYFRALQRWPVGEVVSILPFLLHLSLFLFFAGMVVFLWTLDQSIGIWILVLGSLLAVFYLGCTFVPLWIPECPTSTPLIHQLRRVTVPYITGALSFCVDILDHALRLRGVTMHHTRRLQHIIRSSRASHIVTSLGQRCAQALAALMSRRSPRQPMDIEVPAVLHRGTLHQPRAATSLVPRLRDIITHLGDLRDTKSAITRHTERNRDELDASALTWLIFDVSDSDATAVGFQALGGIHPASALADRLRADDRLACFPEKSGFTLTTAKISTAEMLRVLRSILCMTRNGRNFSLELRMPSLKTFLKTSCPDIALADVVYFRHASDAILYRSSSLTSTIIHLLRSGRLHPEYRCRYLRFCDFALFSDDDWTFALQMLVSDKSAETMDVPTVYRPLILAAAIAQSTSGLPGAEEHEDVISDLLLRVDGLVRDGTVWPRLPFSGEYPQLSPSMLSFIASKAFINHMRVPRAAFHLVRDWLCNGLLSRCPPFTSDHWPAIASVTHLSLSVGGSAGLTKYEVFTIAAACSDGLHRGRVHGHTTLLHALVAILKPYSPLVTESIWEMLWKGDVSDMTDIRPNVVDSSVKLVLNFKFAALTYDLAGALCLHRRGCDDPACCEVHVDSFFGELNYTYVWPIIEERAQKGVSNDNVVRFLRHCGELRPRWLHNALTDKYDGTEEDRRLILSFNAEVCSGDPCQSCAVCVYK